MFYDVYQSLIYVLDQNTASDHSCGHNTISDTRSYVDFLVLTQTFKYLTQSRYLN